MKVLKLIYLSRYFQYQKAAEFYQTSLLTLFFQKWIFWTKNQLENRTFRLNIRGERERQKLNAAKSKWFNQCKILR